ncbi:MAG: hypothetical protein HY927_16275 [Elusimicrobia bacterium]|nr:hypothetical protein [Elusimicrobiota bacterium]
MTRVLALAAGVAAANVALGWRLGLGSFAWLRGGLGWRQGVVQAAGFLGRAGLLFLTAHMIFVMGGRPLDVVSFIIMAALLQMAGQIWLTARRERVSH